MKIDYELERIQNGYIAKGNDSTQCKIYYETIKEFLAATTADHINELQETHKHHHCDGEKLRITMSVEAV